MAARVSEGVYGSWTLAREERRLTCTLVKRVTGRYVLRMTYEGCVILDEPCQSPEHAVSRSTEMFQSLAARGWLHEASNN